MYSNVRNEFRAFNNKFEGTIHHMYLDVKGLVTIGVGNLIDSSSIAMTLPFQYKNGKRATKEEIKQEWDKIKLMQDKKGIGGGKFGIFTTLFLNEIAISKLVKNRLDSNERVLLSRPQYKEFERWPADAQLALLSMAWAAGAAKFDNWRNFKAACIDMDFDTVAEESRMIEKGQPKEFKERNKLTHFLFKNAAAVIASESAGFREFQRSVLYYPAILCKPITL